MDRWGNRRLHDIEFGRSDEADRMLDRASSIDQEDHRAAPETRQTLFFATLSKEIERVAKDFLKIR
jgi:superfamily II DNA/RNA helicase